MADLGLALQLLLERCPSRFNLIDVGARWGVTDRWAPIRDCSDVLCFEPETEECSRLVAQRQANVRYLPFALGEQNAERDLILTAEPACSSFFEPLQALHEHYPTLGIIKPERTVRVPCRRLDDVLAEHRIDEVAAIKLDTQGAELSILRGSRSALKSCFLVDVEVTFNALYDGQGLFWEVDRLLRDNGLVLWRLENLVHYAPELVAAAQTDFLVSAEPGGADVRQVSNGQLFWAQAHYVRASFPRTSNEHVAADVAIPAAVITALYGHWDLSLELARKSGDAELLQKFRTAVC